jgi:hypothetical protein
MESPVYAILKLGPEMDKFQAPGGYAIEQHMAALPTDAEHYSMKWDGEWHITYEVFRDLGIAFAAVLILIYGLVVGWFQSFITPLVIMAAIPFSLVGILPAHGLMNAFFTATSMIGFIAGAGIVVRNSIILVDFIELRLQEGMPLDQAVIDALHLGFRRVGDSSRRRHEIRHVKACHADPAVGHSVIDVEAVRRSKIVAPVDAGGEYDVGDGAIAFLRQRWRQHRLRGTIADHARMLLRKHHHASRVT